MSNSPRRWRAPTTRTTVHCWSPVSARSVIPCCSNVRWRSILTDALRVEDFWSIAGQSGESSALQAAAFEWLAGNFAALAAKLGDDAASALPFAGAGFCDTTGRARVQQFFDDPQHQRPGSPRNLAHVLESIDECIRLRARATASVAAFLSRSP